MNDPSHAKAPSVLLLTAIQERLRGLFVDTLHWSLGLFCAAIGALMLVAPHQFHAAGYLLLEPYLALWGLLGLGVGIALLAVPVARPDRTTILAVQGLAGLVLIALGWSFTRTGSWLGPLFYLVLGLGTLLGGPGRDWRQRQVAAAGGGGGDLLALLLGLAMILAGGVLLARGPGPLGAFRTRPDLAPLFVGLWLVAGPLLVWAQLKPAPPRPLVLLAHLLGGGTLLAMALFVALPNRGWTGVALHGGCGLVVLSLPWLGPILKAADPAALRTRLSLALALATSVTLILGVAVVTDQEERLAAEQVRQMQRVEASSIAQNIADFLEFNVARVAAVASLAGSLPMERGAQAEFLQNARGLYPDLAAFVTVDLQGEVLAQVGDLALGGPALHALASEVDGIPRERLALHFARRSGQPLLVLTAAIPGPSGRRVGALIAAFDTTALNRRIDRPGSRVTLADGQGQTIAALNRADGNTPPLPAGWDRAVSLGRPFQASASLGAFATVPPVGWAVAVERPPAAALAGVRRGRDVAFLLLLGCAALAVAVGIATARRMARPLGSLADAVDQLAAGNPRAPVETSSVAEIARLAVAFRELRDRLVARTAESERLAAELRTRVEALAETDRRKDEFLAMLAHELRNPLGAIANASHLLTHLRDPEPPMARAAEVIERQVRHLVRMVDDLLDVSRITRGKVELRRELLDLVEVIRQTVEGNRALWEDRQLSLELPTHPLPLTADLTRLEQIVSNLLRNAAKFTEPGDRITVAAMAEGGEAVVRIADTGIGIAPELLPRVFDLFTQGDQSLDRRGSGLGIGLTMVRQLIELHGGRVEARSAGTGQGAEFVIRLPLEAQPETVAAVSSGPRPQPASVRSPEEAG
ncbi:MAG TPA: sensor histidine kinase [Thermoanaerobaculia bacterium]|nr:sensor histidine kinase [Thermoanaerobaculia bacterium]